MQGNAFLDESDIPYVTDETNLTCDYTRNYVRHEILPRLGRLNPNPESAALRVIDNLRSEVEYIDSVAREFLDRNAADGQVDAVALARLHRGVASRVILMLSAEDELCAEAVHVEGIITCLSRGGDFEISLPGKRSFVRRGDRCFVREGALSEARAEAFTRQLKQGFNEIPELNI